MQIFLKAGRRFSVSAIAAVRGALAFANHLVSVLLRIRILEGKFRIKTDWRWFSGKSKLTS